MLIRYSFLFRICYGYTADFTSPELRYDHNSEAAKDIYSDSSASIAVSLEINDKSKLINQTVKDSTSASYCEASENKPNLNVVASLASLASQDLDENKPKPFPDWTVHDERRPLDPTETAKWEDDLKIKNWFNFIY